MTNPTTTNGVYGQDAEISHIVEALQAIYNPSSTNETRQAASSFLEDAKKHQQAPERGFSLAIDHSRDLVLRHYGLSILEYYIKYVWQGDEEAERVLRGYVTQLADGLRAEDPPFVRNKVAQLWSEIAKRSWGLAWMDMDQMLNQCWNDSPIRKMFVLYVLETLSEEIFTKDEGGVRGNELGQACIEIFTPASVLPERAAARHEDAPVLRCGSDGWLKRFCAYLESYLSGRIGPDDQSGAIAVKVLQTVRSTLSWISPKAVSATNTIVYLCGALDSGNVQMKDVR
jgi:exportin-5